MRFRSIHNRTTFPRLDDSAQDERAATPGGRHTKGLAAGIAFVACLLPSTAALASPVDNGSTTPHRIYQPLEAYDAAAGTVCSFPVRVSPDTNQYSVHRTTSSDGTVTERITGRFFVTLTNLATGRSETFNVSGPGTSTTNPDGSGSWDGQGRGFFVFGTASQQKFGVPGIALTIGHVAIQVSSTGRATSVSLPPRTIDGCAAIA